MTSVIVPDHVANEIEKEKVEEATTNEDSVYVEPQERVLDPSLLDKSILERMPQPTGWRILILPYILMGPAQSQLMLVTM